MAVCFGPPPQILGVVGGGLLCRCLRFFHTLVHQYGEFVGVRWGWLVQPVVIERGLFGSRMTFGDVSWAFFVFHFAPWGFHFAQVVRGRIGHTDGVQRVEWVCGSFDNLEVVLAICDGGDLFHVVVASLAAAC